jgi:uncharacterized membrane protein YkvA (DUF1232 family)
MSSWLERWSGRVHELKTEVYAVYLAYRDPRVPWYARLFAAVLVGLALSPIDLVPDFIPILGYLDDLLLVPLGVMLVIRMIPSDVMDECRSRAEQAMTQGKPVNRAAAVAIVALWVGLLVLALWWAVRALRD